MPRPRLRILMLSLILPTAGTVAQEQSELPAAMPQVPHYCVPPEEPITDPASLEYIGVTLTQEFSRYFNEAGAYMHCLERSLRETTNRARELNELYQSILN